MTKRNSVRISSVCGTAMMLLHFSAVSAQPALEAVPQDETLAADQEADAAAIIVTGSRSQQARSNVDTAAPIDVVNVEQLTQTGQVEVAQMINFVAPSFNSAKQTIANGTDHIDPATLRGLGPDQTLLLLNGKRQHTTALVNVNSTVGRGSVGYDMNVIPAAAVERIEVLRDGAAAQYGSDAIAGVINIGLKRNDSGIEWRNQAGITKEGDGRTLQTSVNAGFGLGDGGFINATLAFLDRGFTDRSGEYNNTVYLASLPATRFPGFPFSVPLTPAEIARQQQDQALVEQRGFDRRSMIVGNSEATGYSAFVNMGLPLGNDWEAYSFGGWTHRDGRAAGFYRYPNNPRTSNLSLFPDGYLPFIETSINDYTIAVGAKTGKRGDLIIDISSKFGGNEIAFDVDNSINASMGNATPTNFYAGKLKFQQFTNNIDLSKEFDGLFGTQSFNIAAGAELRFDRYAIGEGQVESYGDFNPPGTPPAQIKASGVQVFGGFRPDNAVSEGRRSIGVYLDLESDITDRLLVSGAVRYENYSDFGGNFSGKLVGRYKITDALALRGGLNRGFRAPSLHQSYFSSVATQFITVAGVNQQREVTTVRNDSAIAQRLGVPLLKPETSWSYSAGATLSLGRALNLTVDAYQIDIADRIVISGRFSNTIPALAQFFAGTNVTEAQFFTNAIDTRTRGLDVVATSMTELGRGKLSASLALNLNQTKIRGGVRTPPQLGGFGETLLNREERGRIEVNQPRSKIIGALTYEIDGFSVRTAITRFGEITTVAPQLPEQDQTFSPKIITDLSIAYRFSQTAELVIGASNLFDVYPDRVLDPRLTNDGTVPFSRFATQFGFNGASYFTALNFKF
ncbi:MULTISPECIES: TonB-dependent receptor [unclassified Novosphingobium]|uniref:TonB-dependent receptor plug domain-containing protein n=1 Tax=unclassified Novosphingobium TaxID=2644732 RepID=UPI0025F85CB6|nr:MULTISPECIES: TonB-dependent receptor [unclassified Novosphingobium]HQS68746.1 TonB-dependent receptor [Novosphingobium sp.]